MLLIFYSGAPQCYSPNSGTFRLLVPAARIHFDQKWHFLSVQMKYVKVIFPLKLIIVLQLFLAVTSKLITCHENTREIQIHNGTQQTWPYPQSGHFPSSLMPGQGAPRCQWWKKKVLQIQQFNIISPILHSSPSEKVMDGENMEKYRADLKVIQHIW